MSRLLIFASPGMRLLRCKGTHIGQQFHPVLDPAKGSGLVEGVHVDGLGGIQPAPVDEVLQPIEIQGLILELEPAHGNVSPKVTHGEGIVQSPML